MHLLRYIVKSTVTNSPHNTQASCSKCPPAACLYKYFLTSVTRGLVNVYSTAALLTLLAALRVRWGSASLLLTLCGPRLWTKCYESYGG